MVYTDTFRIRPIRKAKKPAGYSYGEARDYSPDSAIYQAYYEAHPEFAPPYGAMAFQKPPEEEKETRWKYAPAQEGELAEGVYVPTTGPVYAEKPGQTKTVSLTEAWYAPGVEIPEGVKATIEQAPPTETRWHSLSKSERADLLYKTGIEPASATALSEREWGMLPEDIQREVDKQAQAVYVPEFVTPPGVARAEKAPETLLELIEREVFPDQYLDNLESYLISDPEGFWKDIFDIGKTPETLYLISQEFGVTQRQADWILSSEEEQLHWLQQNTQVRNEETEAALRERGFTTPEIDNLFTPPAEEAGAGRIYQPEIAQAAGVKTKPKMQPEYPTPEVFYKPEEERPRTGFFGGVQWLAQQLSEKMGLSDVAEKFGPVLRGEFEPTEGLTTGQMPASRFIKPEMVAGMVPTTPDEAANLLISLAPGIGTAYFWDQMPNWMRALSIVGDLAIVAPALKPATTAAIKTIKATPGVAEAMARYVGGVEARAAEQLGLREIPEAVEAGATRKVTPAQLKAITRQTEGKIIDDVAHEMEAVGNDPTFNPTFDVLVPEFRDIEKELWARGQPFHGGMKGNVFPQYTYDELVAYRNAYVKALGGEAKAQAALKEADDALWAIKERKRAESGVLRSEATAEARYRNALIPPQEIVRAEEMAPRTAVQTGLPGMGVRGAQAEMMPEFGGVGVKGKLAEVPKPKVAGQPELPIEPAPRVAGKEPWQMTRGEYLRYQESLNQERIEQFTHQPYQSVAPITVDKSTARTMHKMEVEQALREGKPVPRGVLKDYPDLVAKVPPAAGKAPEITVGDKVTLKKGPSDYGGQPLEVVGINEFGDVHLIEHTGPKSLTDYGWTRWENVSKVVPETAAKGAGAAYDELLARATRRNVMEVRGQEVLDTLTEAGVSPKAVSDRFWASTYAKLPKEVQTRFQRYLKALTGFEPGATIATDRAGNPIIGRDWVEIGRDYDLSNVPEGAGMLQGTERGYVVLMDEANRRVGSTSVRDILSLPEARVVEGELVPPVSEAPTAAPTEVPTGAGEPRPYPRTAGPKFGAPGEVKPGVTEKGMPGVGKEPPEPPKPPSVTETANLPPEDALSQAVRDAHIQIAAREELIRGVKAGQRAIGETAPLRSAVRAKQTAAMESIFAKNKGKDAFIKARGVLKGKLPVSDFAPPKITPEQEEALYETIRGSGLSSWDFTHAGTGLGKILEGVLPQMSELKVLDKVFGWRFTRTVLEKRPWRSRLWSLSLDLANLPRATLASFDISFPLRQGLLYQFSHPTQAIPGYKYMMKALGSDEAAMAIDEEIRTRASFALRMKYGDYHAPLSMERMITPERWAKMSPEYRVQMCDAAKISHENAIKAWNDIPQPAQKELRKLRSTTGGTVETWTREEAYQTPLADVIPGIRQSQRAYISYGNRLRADVWDQWMRHWERIGYKPTDKDYMALASWNKIATGRGPLGSAEKWSPALNTLLFSVRFQSARLMTPVQILTATPAVRKLVIRDIVSSVAALSAIVSLAALHPDVSVETDRRSSDFGSIKVGNTRIDVFGGFKQWAVFIARLTGEMKASGSGKMYPTDYPSLFERLVRSKESPAFGFIHDLVKGETMMGEEVVGEGAEPGKQAMERLVPMAIQDVIDAVRDSGWTHGFLAAPSFFGVGLNTYNSPTTKLATMRDTVASELYEGKAYGDLDLLDKAKVNLDARVREAIKLADSTATGGDTPYESWHSEVLTNRANRAEGWAALQKEWDTGKLTGEQFRDKADDITSDYISESDSISGRYPSLLAQFEEYRDEPTEVLDQAYDEYVTQIYDPKLEDEYGNPDYTEMDKRRDAIRAKYGEETWTRLQEYLVSDPNMPPMVKELRIARETLRPFWRLRDQAFAQSPELQELADRITLLAASLNQSDRDEAKRLRALNPNLTELEENLENLQWQWRQDNPEGDMALRKFYGRGPLKEEPQPTPPESLRITAKWFDIEKEYEAIPEKYADIPSTHDREDKIESDRKDFLTKNPDYREDRYRRTAYNYGFKIKTQDFTKDRDRIVGWYVEYRNFENERLFTIPGTTTKIASSTKAGTLQKNFRASHPIFERWLVDVVGLEPTKGKAVPTFGGQSLTIKK